MTLIVHTVFTASAEAQLQGATGLHAIDYHGVFPLPGDTVIVRTSPGNQVLETRCQARRFSFARAGALDLTIELDMP